MTGYDAWIGRSETLYDTVDTDRVAGLMALLDHDETALTTLPLLGHWLFGRSHVSQSALGTDGHAARGGLSLLPPITLPRRMWAGSDIDFIAPVPIGSRLERRSTVASIDEKVGSSGKLVFVVLNHDISANGQPAVRERQHLVYREAPSGVASAVFSDTREALTSRTIVPDPIQLFRYSALTFNAHRIHYDRDYARREEGYRALVVHGPYAATLMLHQYLVLYPLSSPARFAFRARAPLFDDQPFTICIAGSELWIRSAEGHTAMTASVTDGAPLNM